ncbi:MAG: hypothetical protein JO256_05250 [Alphaproteobacteria bacterium]|nr:hypothetical protein [Alphaproteobacteria bacterium]
MESKLEQARRHVMTGQGIVTAQRRRVAALRARGEDCREAERLLLQFEGTQAIFEADLAALQPKD